MFKKEIILFMIPIIFNLVVANLKVDFGDIQVDRQNQYLVDSPNSEPTIEDEDANIEIFKKLLKESKKAEEEAIKASRKPYCNARRPAHFELERIRNIKQQAVSVIEGANALEMTIMLNMHHNKLRT